VLRVPARTFYLRSAGLPARVLTVPFSPQALRRPACPREYSQYRSVPKPSVGRLARASTHSTDESSTPFGLSARVLTLRMSPRPPSVGLPARVLTVPICLRALRRSRLDIKARWNRPGSFHRPRRERVLRPRAPDVCQTAAAPRPPPTCASGCRTCTRCGASPPRSASVSSPPAAAASLPVFAASPLPRCRVVGALQRLLPRYRRGASAWMLASVGGAQRAAAAPARDLRRAAVRAVGDRRRKARHRACRHRARCIGGGAPEERDAGAAAGASFGPPALACCCRIDAASMPRRCRVDAVICRQSPAWPLTRDSTPMLCGRQPPLPLTAQTRTPLPLPRLPHSRTCL
jgi:hypothetical protein